MQPGQILDQPIEEEMHRSYLSYAMSVIVGRALPDVRDGLKPIHRRILFGMREMNLTPERPYRKSALVVGDVMGKYHPHGDSAIYDAMVRMAQPFSMSGLLVDGQGNFGSMDGDNAAAMRYTEARLSKLAMEVLQDIDLDTVPFIPNYDANMEEPLVLPAKYPNLLVNGSTGIAVGMATNMAPHNLNEAIDATLLQLERPDCTLQELMEKIPGPDFPTGGSILGKRGIHDAYETGRGRVRVRSKVEIEEHGRSERIIVTEIPYMVNKATMIKQIADLVRDKTIGGIRDLRDESDRHGVRVVIELKRDAIPDIVLNKLFKHTRMETTFSILNLALVDAQPKLLTLKELIHHFIEHRIEVITRRTQHLLMKAEERAHIVEGLITALDNLDDVIDLIRESADTEAARSGLMDQFGLSEEQAKAVLAMRLSRLARMEQQTLQDEMEELRARIEDYNDILARDERKREIIKDELTEIRENFPVPRRTSFEPDPGEIGMEDIVPDDPVVITVTERGYVKRTALEQYRSQHRGGKGSKGIRTRDEDEVTDVLFTTNHAYLLVFSDQGKVYCLRGWEIPESKRGAKGVPIVQLLDGLDPEENVKDVIPTPGFDEGVLVFATKQGLVKRTELSEYQNVHRGGIWAIKLEEGDSLMDTRLSDGESDIILVSRAGLAIRFDEEEARTMGRYTRGVKGINLDLGNEVVAMTLAHGDETLLVLTEKGYGKRTHVEEYRQQGRGGKGIKVAKLSRATGQVVGVHAVAEEEDVLVFTKEGQSIRFPVDEFRVQGRATRGVRTIKLDSDDVVVATVRVPTGDDEANGSPDDEPQPE